MKVEEVAIIGSGPAGLMAALQLKRFGVNPLLLEAKQVGGLLHNANRVENYPGFPGGISGTGLVRLFEEQARASGVEVVFETVLELDYEGALFHIRTDRNMVRSRVVILASGTQAVRFPPGVIAPEAAGRVVYEVACLPAVAGCEIAIVGAGDAAFDYAFSLEDRHRVQILNRSRSVKCLPLLWDHFTQSGRTCYRAETELVGAACRADGGLSLTCRCPDGEATLEVDYLIGALGRVPRLDFVSAHLRERLPALESQGVLYRVGDVKNGRYRQTAIAIGDGLMAAMLTYSYLEGL